MLSHEYKFNIFIMFIYRLSFICTKQEDLTPEDWEHIVAEEEKALWESYKKYPLWALIAFGFWLP